MFSISVQRNTVTRLNEPRTELVSTSVARSAFVFRVEMRELRTETKLTTAVNQYPDNLSQYLIKSYQYRMTRVQTFTINYFTHCYTYKHEGCAVFIVGTV